MTSSGIGFRTAFWDFFSADQAFLHVNRELRLLVSAPAAARLAMSVTIRAKIAAPAGFSRLIPFISKTGGAGGHLLR